MLLNIEVCIAACLLCFEHTSITESSHNTNSCMAKWFALKAGTPPCNCGAIARQTVTVVNVSLFIAVIERLYHVLPKITDSSILLWLLTENASIAFVCFLYTVLVRCNLVGVFSGSDSLNFLTTALQIIPCLHPHCFWLLTCFCNHVIFLEREEGCWASSPGLIRGWLSFHKLC